MNKFFTYSTLLYMSAMMLMIMTSCQPDPLTDVELEEKGLNNDDLLPYLDEFIEIGLANGHDYTYVYDQPISMQFTDDFKYGNNGQSWGINDPRIEIFINADWFKRLTGDRWDDSPIINNLVKYVIFHELAHDILNLKHKHNTPMMDTSPDYDSEDPDGITPLLVIAMDYSKDTGKNSSKESTEPSGVSCSINHVN